MTFHYIIVIFMWSEFGNLNQDNRMGLCVMENFVPEFLPVKIFP